MALNNGTHSTQKEAAPKNASNEISFQSLLLVIVAPIHEVVGDSFQTFHLDSLIWFRYVYIILHTLITVCFPLLSDYPPKSSQQSPLSQLANFARSQLFVTTLHHDSVIITTITITLSHLQAPERFWKLSLPLFRRLF